jgi:N-formylglutamate deformylase
MDFRRPGFSSPGNLCIETRLFMDVFQLVAGEGPLVAAAIHNGHYVRADVAEQLALTDAERLREEDPYTDVLIEWAPTRFIGLRSRYEIDLNRPRNLAVYLTPEQAWGANVWKAPLSAEILNRSLADYDLFYSTAETVLRRLVKSHGRVLVLDVHTYNHRRGGADGVYANPEQNPQVNVGTGSMDRARWAPVVDGFMSELRAYNYFGRPLDVRENVRFLGGNFCRWIHQTFPDSVCGLAVEFKKFFMDEWTGEADRGQLAELRTALQSTAPRLLQVLSNLENEASS